MTHIKSNTIGICVFVLSLLANTTSIAAHGTGHHVGWGGNYHGHGGHGGYGNGYGHGGYYNGGGFYFGGGWGGPNVVINVPAEGYYAPPVCENVQVCDTYRDECWLERHCG